MKRVGVPRHSFRMARLNASPSGNLWATFIAFSAITMLAGCGPDDARTRSSGRPGETGMTQNRDDESLASRLCDQAAQAKLPRGAPFDADYGWKVTGRTEADPATIERQFVTRRNGERVTASYVCTLDRRPTRVTDLQLR